MKRVALKLAPFTMICNGKGFHAMYINVFGSSLFGVGFYFLFSLNLNSDSV